MLASWARCLMFSKGNPKIIIIFIVHPLPLERRTVIASALPIDPNKLTRLDKIVGNGLLSSENERTTMLI